MTPQRLKQLAADPRFIAGVYNYCDRWCERCPFTSRCLNYAMGQESMGEGAESRDLNNKEFWSALDNSFKLALELIKDDCEKRGIDFDEVPRQASEEAKKDTLKAARKKRKDHPLVASALRYMKHVDKWFKGHKKVFKEKGLELAGLYRMGLKPQADIEAALRDLQDAVEVVRWYYMFISAKLYRAVRQEEDGEDPSAIADDEIRSAVIESRDSDTNGSAKIALIALDRSLGAWAKLRDHLPAEGDVIIDLLVELDRLRQAVEGAFPKAREFVRPGFDDGTPVPSAPKPKRRKKS